MTSYRAWLRWTRCAGGWGAHAVRRASTAPVWLLCVLLTSCAPTPTQPDRAELILTSEPFTSAGLNAGDLLPARGNGRGRGHTPPPPPSPPAPYGDLSLNAADWRQQYCSVPLSSPLFFTFPALGQCVSYLFHSHPPLVLSGPITITTQVTVTSGTPVFYDRETQTPCPSGLPAKARPFFIARDNWGAIGHEWARWWANPIAFTLEPGSRSLSVPIDPAQWSSVYGVFGNASPQALAGFEDARTHVSGLGITFGCASFFAHSGRARLSDSRDDREQIWSVHVQNRLLWRHADCAGGAGNGSRSDGGQRNHSPTERRARQAELEEWPRA